MTHIQNALNNLLSHVKGLFEDEPRLALFLWPSLLFGLVAIFNYQQLALVAYKISMVFLAGYFGFRFDRRVFHYSRPDLISGLGPKATDMRRATAEIRRAIVIVGAMIAVALAI